MASGSDSHTIHDSFQYEPLTNSQHDNPLFLQNSDSPGMKLVSDVFDGTGYSNWKRSMTIALSARNKLGFVTGTLPRPDPSSPSFTSWSRFNDMVISWILGALSKSIGRSVIYCTTAHQMWAELEERYAVGNGAQLFGLHKSINELSQGNDTIADYFTKLKVLWDDLESLRLAPVCSCGAASHISKHHHDQKVIQFLMGLNDTYTIMRGSILMKSPLPNLSQTYNILLQEEAQREIHSGSNFMTEAASLAVHSGTSGSYPSSAKRPGVDSRKSNLQCNYCKKPGHLIDKCYKLHGFPADFKFTKGKRFAAQAEVSDRSPSPSSVASH